MSAAPSVSTMAATCSLWAAWSRRRLARLCGSLAENGMPQRSIRRTPRWASTTRTAPRTFTVRTRMRTDSSMPASTCSASANWGTTETGTKDAASISPTRWPLRR